MAYKMSWMHYYIQQRAHDDHVCVSQYVNLLIDDINNNRIKDNLPIANCKIDNHIWVQDGLPRINYHLHSINSEWELKCFGEAYTTCSFVKCRKAFKPEK